VSLPDLFFYLISLSLLGFGVAMMASNNVFRQAVYLAISLAMTAGLYILLGSEFLAALQIMVYVGAVVVLLIFAIMLTEVQEGHYPLFFNRQTVVARLIVPVT